VGIERKKKIQEVEEMIQRAIAFATKAHEGQLRKGTMRPYILHPLEVGVIVARMTEDEEIISAAILHDTIEDCEGVTAQMIEQMFSKRVAELVQKESEDKSKTWMERKGATIQHLKVAEREVQMIGLADKLSNMRDIDRDYPECGEEVWQRFRMKDKETIGWYYKGVEEALRNSFSEVPAYMEYRSLVEKIFGK
jgi:(p)ppGpp synthase/HD superfamily hydrolase